MAPLTTGAVLLARIVPQFTRGRVLTRLARLTEAERAYVDAVRFARGVASDTTELPPLREEAERHLAMLEQELAAHRERYGQRVPDAPGNAPRARAVGRPVEGPRVVH